MVVKIKQRKNPICKINFVPFHVINYPDIIAENIKRIPELNTNILFIY